MICILPALIKNIIVNIIQSCLNKDLVLSIGKWLIANKLTLDMTEFMLIGSRQKLKTQTTSPVLNINGTPINQVLYQHQNLWVYSLMQTLYGAVISKGWLKKLPLV